MHVNHLTLLLSPVVAFTIHKGQADGVYQISYIDGHEVHELINDTNPTAATSPVQPSAKITKRDNYNYGGCGGDALNHEDTDRANSALDAQCGSGAWVSAGRDYYSVVGCTVAYFCNSSNTAPLRCTTADRQSMSGKITGRCGWYKSGWAMSHTVQGNDLASYGDRRVAWSLASRVCVLLFSFLDLDLRIYVAIKPSSKWIRKQSFG